MMLEQWFIYLWLAPNVWCQISISGTSSFSGVRWMVSSWIQDLLYNLPNKKIEAMFEYYGKNILQVYKIQIISLNFIS